MHEKFNVLESSRQAATEYLWGWSPQRSLAGRGIGEESDSAGPPVSEHLVHSGHPRASAWPEGSSVANASLSNLWSLNPDLVPLGEGR